MDWSGDVARGEWLRARLDVPWRDMHSVVPHGFPAYARVFHPVLIDRPAGAGTWSGPERGFPDGIDCRSVPWARVADAWGGTMHPLAQFGRLYRGQFNAYDELVDADGWRYSAPDTGNLDPAVLAAVAAHLAAHTGTPDAGVAAVWEGWGTFLSPAPSLLLPGRAYALADAGARRFVAPGWVTDAPWTDSPDWPQSPNLLWPDDHAWVLVSEIDFDSTVVAGSRALVQALLGDPAVEALELAEGADLTSEGDTINPPPR